MENTGISAAALLELVQKRIDGIAPEVPGPLMALAAATSPFSGNILELHFDKCMNSIDFATRINKQFDAALIPEYYLPATPYGLNRLIGEDHGIENIWIEYDAPFSQPPALFFDLNRKTGFCTQVVCSSLQQIAGRLDYPLATRLLPFLQLVHQLRLQVVQYGFMFSRQTRSVRLTIHGITPETLQKQLYQLGWKGNYHVLEQLRTAYLHAGQKLVIGIDLDEGIANRIGIEVFDKASQTFIHTLYKNGRIGAAHATLFTHWPGSHPLPEDISHRLEQLQQRQADRLYTRINHFKFVVDDTGVTELKGYLYYCY